MRVLLIGSSACAALLLAACGQRGPLYMPDRNAQVVTRAAASAPAPAASSGPSSAPSSAPAAAPTAEPR